MNDHDQVRQHYLQDSLPTRLVRVAANIQRIAWLTEKPDSAAITELLRECSQSIEWSVPELASNWMNEAAYLVDVQRALAHWEQVWDSAQHDPAQRMKLAEEAREWSVEILYLSGLVDE